jgi:hypothetical protein
MTPPRFARDSADNGAPLRYIFVGENVKLRSCKLEEFKFSQGIAPYTESLWGGRMSVCVEFSDGRLRRSLDSSREERPLNCEDVDLLRRWSALYAPGRWKHHHAGAEPFPDERALLFLDGPWESPAREGGSLLLEGGHGKDDQIHAARLRPGGLSQTPSSLTFLPARHNAKFPGKAETDLLARSSLLDCREADGGTGAVHWLARRVLLSEARGERAAAHFSGELWERSRLRMVDVIIEAEGLDAAAALNAMAAFLQEEFGVEAYARKAEKARGLQGFDPDWLAVCLSIPPAIIATVDLAERAKLTERVSAVLEKARPLLTVAKGVIRVGAGRIYDIATVTAKDIVDALLDACDDDR